MINALYERVSRALLCTQRRVSSCRRQIRTSVCCRVLGVDMMSALGFVRAHGFDEDTVSALLQAAEVGLIKAKN